MLELGLILFFSIGGLWMYVTTPDQRQMVLGYVIALAVAKWVRNQIERAGIESGHFVRPY